jgi:GNAT superfamily N-acetyltransferase
LELTKTIWEGQDYVPQVWESWLNDSAGRLMVAEHQGRVLGLGKLTRLSSEDWWLEGLRVHPEFERQGIASSLFGELVSAWQRTGSGIVRFITSSERVAVHRMAEKLGFVRGGEYTGFRAATNPAYDEQKPRAMREAPTLPFRPLTQEEAGEAVQFAANNPAKELTGAMMDMGWQWGAPQPEFMASAIQRRQAWWWRGRQGLLIFHLDNDPGEKPRPFIELLACPPRAIPELLIDFRLLAGAIGHETVEWTAHKHPDLIAMLAAAGYTGIWDDSIYLFEKQHD